MSHAAASVRGRGAGEGGKDFFVNQHCIRIGEQKNNGRVKIHPKLPRGTKNTDSPQ